MRRIVAGYTVGVNDHQEIAQAAQAKGDEALLAVSVGIFSGQGEFIFQDRCGFRESYVVITDVRFGFLWIPVDPHVKNVRTIVR